MHRPRHTTETQGRLEHARALECRIWRRRGIVTRPLMIATMDDDGATSWQALRIWTERGNYGQLGGRGNGPTVALLLAFARLQREGNAEYGIIRDFVGGLRGRVRTSYLPL